MSHPVQVTTPRKRKVGYVQLPLTPQSNRRTRSKGGAPTPNPPLAPFPTPPASRTRKAKFALDDDELAFEGAEPKAGPSKQTFEKSLPQHLQTILKHHHAFNLALSLHIATKPPILPPHPPSTTQLQLPCLTNFLAIRETVERTGGRRFAAQDLARLAWLWQWDGETLPTENRGSETDNPFLVKRSEPHAPVSAPEADVVSAMSYVITATKTLDHSGKRANTYGLGIELDLKPGETRQMLHNGAEGGLGNKGQGGGMGAVGRWNNHGEERLERIMAKLRKWIDLHGGYEPPLDNGPSSTVYPTPSTTSSNTRSSIPPIPLLRLPMFGTINPALLPGRLPPQTPLSQITLTPSTRSSRVTPATAVKHYPSDGSVFSSAYTSKPSRVIPDAKIRRTYCTPQAFYTDSTLTSIGSASSPATVEPKSTPATCQTDRSPSTSQTADTQRTRETDASLHTGRSDGTPTAHPARRSPSTIQTDSTLFSPPPSTTTGNSNRRLAESLVTPYKAGSTLTSINTDSTLTSLASSASGRRTLSAPGLQTPVQLGKRRSHPDDTDENDPSDKSSSSRKFFIGKRPIPSAPSTDADTPAKDLFDDQPLSVAARRRNMQERIRQRKSEAASATALSGWDPRMRSIPPKGKSLGGSLTAGYKVSMARLSAGARQAELQRRATLSRTEGTAETVWMIFSGSPSTPSSSGSISLTPPGNARRKTMRLDEVVEIIVKSSKMPISHAEAEASLRMLVQICPFFLVTKTVGRAEYVEMPAHPTVPPSSPTPSASVSAINKNSYPSMARYKRAVTPPPTLAAAMDAPPPSSSPSAGASPRTLGQGQGRLAGPASPGRVRRSGGLREVRERIRRELEMGE